MSRSSSGIVAGLTVAAVAVVGFLAYQASANVPETLGKPNGAPSGSHSSGSMRRLARAEAEEGRDRPSGGVGHG